MAEDNAIEDTIYHLTRALDAERIDLDRFLKVSISIVFFRLGHSHCPFVVRLTSIVLVIVDTLTG